MIKINLLPQKRAKHRAGRARGIAPSGPSTDSGAKALLVGVLIVALSVAGVLLLVHFPMKGEIISLQQERAEVDKKIRDRENDPKLDLKTFDQLVQAEKDAIAKIQSINRLLDNRVVPANVLHELGQVLTVRGPTMTDRMAKAVEKDANKRFDPAWDPTHVWITAFRDGGGTFTLEGGAQSKEDVTQLSKRLAASVYFGDVTPAGGERVSDRDTGLSFFKFTITGKVAY
jgi:Tfp pilus assembly protein PilN